jgi:hypothetical protein
MAVKGITIKRTSVAGRLLEWSRTTGTKMADQPTSVTLRQAALPGLAAACEMVSESPASIKKLPASMAIETVKCLVDDNDLDLLLDIAKLDKRRTVRDQINQELDRLGVDGDELDDVFAPASPTKPFTPPKTHDIADIDKVVRDLGCYDTDALIEWINAASKQFKKAALSALQASGYAGGGTYYSEEQKRAAQVLAGVGCALIDGRITADVPRGSAPTDKRAGKVTYPGAWVAWRAWSSPVTKELLESVLIREDHWPQEYETEGLVSWLSSKARKFTPDATRLLATSPDPVLLSVAVNRKILSDSDLAKLLESCEVYTLVRLIDIGVSNNRYQALFKVLFARMRKFSHSDTAHVVDWISEDWAEVLSKLTMTPEDLELLLTTLDIRFAEEWSKGTWKAPATQANLERVANALITTPNRLRELTGSGSTSWLYDFEADTPLAKTLIPIIPGLVHTVFANHYHWAEDAVCTEMYQAFGTNQRAWEIGLSLAVGWPGTLGDYLNTVATLEAQS